MKWNYHFDLDGDTLTLVAYVPYGGLFGQSGLGAFSMTRFIPPWLSGHRAVLVALAALIACAFVVAATDDQFGYAPSELLKSLVTVIVVCGTVTYLCAAIVRMPPNSDSWLITALILFFVMPVANDSATWKTAAIGAAAAALSKYVLVWRKRLIVNPVVVGAVVCYADVAPDIGGLMYIPWWVAAEPLLIPMLVIGALLVTVLRVWELVAVYLAASAITLLIAGQVTAVPDLKMWLTSTPVLFLGTIMLPEPRLAGPARAAARLRRAGRCADALPGQDRHHLVVRVLIRPGDRARLGLPVRVSRCGWPPGRPAESSCRRPPPRRRRAPT